MTDDAGDAGVVWRPTDAYLSRSRLLRFMAEIGVDDLADLDRRAALDPGWYWDAAVRHLGVSFAVPYDHPLDRSAGAPWAEWFPGARYNYVTDALHRHVGGSRRDAAAAVWEGDDGATRRLTYRDLADETGRCANALSELGIRPGDRVGVFLPMIPETVVSVLACGQIGAVIVPMFSGFGAEALAARLRDSGATALITCDGFPRRGKPVPMKAVADEALRGCPDVRAVVVVRRTGAAVPMVAGRDHRWDEIVPRQAPIAPVADTAANDPYMLIYTSGTTGRPKSTVHVHAGFPIKAAHDLAFCFDLGADDTLFWLTDLGWMMGPWLIAGGLFNGATLVLFEGTPDHPGPDRLWRLVADRGVTVFGIAPTAIRSLMTAGEAPVRGRDLSSLRVLGSTGETWNPAPWRWFFDVVGGGRCPIINYSGGTEIGGGIVGCTTIQPQKPCAFTGPVPGMAVEVFDEAGEPVRGAVGELVVTQPWVGMTRGFWGDPERYLDTYWSRFPETWVHGDWAEVDDDGFWFIRGRSDDTIKVAGKRIGPAEVESAACAHPAVVEAAAIGVPDAVKGEVVVVVAVPRDGVAAATLAAEVRATIGKLLGAALRPERVELTGELPRTRNAKVMRRVVRAAYLGLPVGDISALENPGAVERIARLGGHVRSTERATADSQGVE